jgi:ferredoxin
MKDGKRHFEVIDECVGCNLCVNVCPVEGCIEMVQIAADRPAKRGACPRPAPSTRTTRRVVEPGVGRARRLPSPATGRRAPPNNPESSSTAGDLECRIVFGAGAF